MENITTLQSPSTTSLQFLITTLLANYTSTTIKQENGMTQIDTATDVNLPFENNMQDDSTSKNSIDISNIIDKVPENSVKMKSSKDDMMEDMKSKKDDMMKDMKSKKDDVMKDMKTTKSYIMEDSTPTESSDKGWFGSLPTLPQIMDNLNFTFEFPSFNLTLNSTHNRTHSRGGGVVIPDPEAEGEFSTDDAAWVLTATFIIFTMQSGKLLD